MFGTAENHAEFTPLPHRSKQRREGKLSSDPSASTLDDSRRPASFRVLGVRVDVLEISDAICQIEQWISRRGTSRFVAVTGMHGVTEAQHDPAFKTILNSADLVVPDGMPLVWLGRSRGHQIKRRVYGPELMEAFLARTQHRGYRHFFFGGAPGISQRLASQLKTAFPQITIADTYSPPFRPPTPDEDQRIIKRINTSNSDILWVGLGTPKQEKWMFEHRNQLNVPVLLGVGAAFDIHAGIKSQAPRLMQEHGLEWLFRLGQEPRRLWRRYLVYGSEFLYWVALEKLGLKKFG